MTHLAIQMFMYICTEHHSSKYNVIYIGIALYDIGKTTHRTNYYGNKEDMSAVFVTA